MADVMMQVDQAAGKEPQAADDDATKQQQQQPPGGGSELETELPKAVVRRIVKAKLVEAGGDTKTDFQINKDALLAFSESAKVFISYVASTANDICREAKRQTLSAEDVLMALQELDFPEMVQLLREFLEGHKKSAKERSRQKEDAKKRKAADGPGQPSGHDDVAAASGEAEGGAHQQQAEDEAGDH